MVAKNLVNLFITQISLQGFIIKIKFLMFKHFIFKIKW